MKKLIIPALALTFVQTTASAAPGTASGPTALALAAVIAQHSPAVRGDFITLLGGAAPAWPLVTKDIHAAPAH
jgi:hypothetical protein